MNQVFPITPAASGALWFLGTVGLVLAGVLGILAYTAWSSRHARVEIDTERVRLVGDLWGRSLPLASLDLARAEVLDLRSDRARAPRGRTFGTGLPGYASGWLRLANGEKALAYLTDRSRVAYVPTTEGYALMLSVEDPARLLAALGRAAGR
ncbi:MAG TPA: PH domain-containing protein [Myxococcota bacterium]|jgi:hypothetical protein|nr:PH domain-containing protein [Myxococcota bacterium]